MSKYRKSLLVVDFGITEIEKLSIKVTNLLDLWEERQSCGVPGILIFAGPRCNFFPNRMRNFGKL